MSSSSANLLTIEELSRDIKFVVPEFQRGYAWQKEQWKALWDDVSNIASRSGAQHYGGTIMTSVMEGNEQEVQLVDGQQRLTSIALMLSALGAKAFEIIFKNNEPLQTYYDYYALRKENLAPSLPQHTSYYARNLAEASQSFSDWSSKLDDDSRSGLIEVLMRRFKLFVLEIPSEFSIHVAFETINNRGKELSKLEKLKNRLIYLAANSKDEAARQDAMNEVHRCWKSVYYWLGKGEKLLDDDEFLRVHSLGWFRHERKAEWLSSQLFEEEFAAHGDATPDVIKVYVWSLEQAAACWYYINEPSALPPEVAKRLFSLQKTASASSRPLLLWALIRLASDNPKLISNPKEDTAWCKPFQELIADAERFAVLVVLANERPANVGQSEMNRPAFLLAHPGEPLLQNLPHLVSPEKSDEAVAFANKHLLSLISNWDEKTEQRVDKRFPWRGHFDSRKIQNVIADRLRKGNGFYNWQFGKLIIYLWEDHLRGDRGKPEKKAWDKFAWDDSVEHIYPQNPHRDWQKSITLDKRTSNITRDAVTNSIGNLMLVSRSRNSSLSNNPYVTSKSTKGKGEMFETGSYSEMQVARHCKEWKVVQIAARGIVMMQLAQKMWEFEVVSDQERLTAWLPILFGDSALKVEAGIYTGGMKVDGRTLNIWVNKFNELLP